MSKALQFSGRLPGNEKNGLEEFEDEFLSVEAPQTIVAVVEIERKKRVVDDDTDEVSALARITHLEVLVDDDAKTVADLMRKAYAGRTGNAELPLEGGDE